MNERWSSRRDIADYAVHSRLRELPRRCQMLAGGLDNNENDAGVVFEGLPYADVMAAALCDVVVRNALATLPTGWAGWAR